MLHSNLVRLPLRRPTGITWLVAAALILVPVLAVLQYRWIGQVSDAERERHERTLRHSTSALTDDLDIELIRAFIGLRVDGSRRPKRQLDRIRGARRRMARRHRGAGDRARRPADRRWPVGRAPAPSGRAISRQFVAAAWTDDLAPYRSARHQRSRALERPVARRAAAADGSVERRWVGAGGADRAGAGAERRPDDPVRAGVRLHDHPARPAIHRRRVPAAADRQAFSSRGRRRVPDCRRLATEPVAA